MYWATTTFWTDGSPGLSNALRAWVDRIKVAHLKVCKFRCHRSKAGTSII
jgi:hypothetical protein